MKFDVIGIGRAFMDIIGHVDDEFLKEFDLIKGQGNVLDVDILREIRDRLPEPKLIPGGAAANSIEGISSLGGSSAFIGKSCSDSLGGYFKESYEKAGVHYSTVQPTPISSINKATGRCIVLVTPDKDRTFAMTLGVCEDLIPEDMDKNLIENSKVLFVEGQMLVSEKARPAVMRALIIAKNAGVKVAFNMHDLNFREERVKQVLGTIRETSDILIGNETEIRNCFDLLDSDNFQEILMNGKQVLAMTRGGKGALIFSNGKIYNVPSENKKEIVDSTGAGDLFAAGFLYGYTKGLPMDIAGLIGAKSAAEILKHWGGRPICNLAEVIQPIISNYHKMSA